MRKVLFPIKMRILFGNRFNDSFLPSSGVICIQICFNSYLLYCSGHPFPLVWMSFPETVQLCVESQRRPHLLCFELNSHMSRTRSACCRHMFVLKRKKNGPLLHSCTPCAAAPSGARSGWRPRTSALDSRSSTKRPQPCAKAQLSICKEHIHQATFKHLSRMLQSHNGFNTLLSAILTIQSRDFP